MRGRHLAISLVCLLVFGVLMCGCVTTSTAPSPPPETVTLRVRVLSYETQAYHIPGAFVSVGAARYITNAAGEVGISVPRGELVTIEASAEGREPFAASATLTHSGETWTFYLALEEGP